MNEFELIADFLSALADTTTADRVRVGPGDDGAVVAVPADAELVSSIDALVADVHFPAGAGASLVGYRALMVALSDLAAMGAQPNHALVALTLPEPQGYWVRDVARGMGRAARDAHVAVVGGNVAQGPLAITVSVHGWVPVGAALLRSGARPGDGVFVTGTLGGAAAALARGGLAGCREWAELDELQRRYFLPQARLQAGLRLRNRATSAIDVSDGLLQDLGHICTASAVGAAICGDLVPAQKGATRTQALTGGDDYELCFTCSTDPGDLGVPATRIGAIVAGAGVTIDGEGASTSGGYQHFS